MFSPDLLPNDPFRLAVLYGALLVLAVLVLLTVRDEAARYMRKRGLLKRGRRRRRVAPHPFFRTRRSIGARLKDRFSSVGSLLRPFMAILKRVQQSFRAWGKKHIYNGEIMVHTVTDHRTGWTTRVYCEEPGKLEFLCRKYFQTAKHIAALHEAKMRHKREEKSRFDYSHHVPYTAASTQPTGSQKVNIMEYEKQVNSEEEYYHGDTLRISSHERYGATPQEEVNKLMYEYTSFEERHTTGKGGL